MNRSIPPTHARRALVTPLLPMPLERTDRIPETQRLLPHILHAMTPRPIRIRVILALPRTARPAPMTLTLTMTDGGRRTESATVRVRVRVLFGGGCLMPRVDRLGGGYKMRGENIGEG